MRSNMPNVAFDPVWKTHEKGIASDNAQTSIRESEAFTEAREKEMKVSKKARDWETSRKKSIAKNKPLFVKKILEEEKAGDPIEQFKKQMKTAGVFDWNLTPTEGFIVIQVKSLPNIRKSGIVLPQEMEEGMENTGIVCGYGIGALHYSGMRVECPAEVGDWILFKKGAGVDITLKGKTCRFMRFDDILGVFKKD